MPSWLFSSSKVYKILKSTYEVAIWQKFTKTLRSNRRIIECFPPPHSLPHQEGSYVITGLKWTELSISQKVDKKTTVSAPNYFHHFKHSLTPSYKNIKLHIKHINYFLIKYYSLPEFHKILKLILNEKNSWKIHIRVLFRYRKYFKVINQSNNLK